MQTNKKQTASFPYLSEELNDYKKTKFNLDIHIGQSEKELCFEATYTINNEDIDKLILEGKLIVVIKLFCQPVGLNLSKKVSVDTRNARFIVNKMDVDKGIEFTAHLIANEGFLYSNSDLSKEWIDDEYWIEKFNDIGTSNKVIVPIEHMKQGKKNSIFRFQENIQMQDAEPVTYKLNEDIICFVMSHKTKLFYDKIQSKNPEAILTTFIIPALTDILRQMKENDDANPEEYNEFNSYHQNKKWYKVIVEKYSKILGQDPTTSDVEPFKAAQILVHSPVSNFLCYLKNNINKEDDE